MRKPLRLLLAALPVVLLLGAAAFVLIRTQRTLNRAAVEVGREGHFPFEMRSLGRQDNPGFEAIASPATYVSGAFYQGKLYVSGPSGLYVYGSKDGASIALLKSYRVGLDLPAAPLGQMVAGRLRGDGEQELMIATKGEGVLIFSANGDMDGSGTFRQLRPKDTDLRDVTALLPLATGELLIGTRRRGLLVYHGGTRGGSDDNSLETFHPQMAGLAVTSLAADATGFWVGTRDRGLRHWHAGQIDSFTTTLATAAGAMPDEEVDSIAVRSDRVYAGTPVGVEEFVDGRPSRLLAKDIFANTIIADERTLTIGSVDQGIQRVSLQGERRPGLGVVSDSDAEAGPTLQFLRTSTMDGGREQLYAVMRNGLRQQRSDGAWAPLEADAAYGANKTSLLTDGNISALAFDPDGRLWIGYFDRGLDILAVGGERIEHREDDHLFCINRIVLDPRRKTMDVATANGLVLFDAQDKLRQVMTRRDGLIADHVTDIAFSGERMVIATPAGVTFMDAAGARSIYGFEGLVNNHVYALGSQPGSSEVLAGTLGGISDLLGESVKRNFTVTNSGLKHNWITAIVPVTGADPGEAWMVGTYGAGVMRMNKDGRFQSMEGATRPMDVNPNAMLVTGTHVFAGTLGSGLWACSRATGRWTQITAGLPSNNVTAIAEKNGDVYVGTDNGLVRIAERLLG